MWPYVQLGNYSVSCGNLGVAFSFEFVFGGAGAMVVSLHKAFVLSRSETTLEGADHMNDSGLTRISIALHTSSGAPSEPTCNSTSSDRC